MDKLSNIKKKGLEKICKNWCDKKGSGITLAGGGISLAGGSIESEFDELINMAQKYLGELFDKIGFKKLRQWIWNWLKSYVKKKRSERRVKKGLEKERNTKMKMKESGFQGKYDDDYEGKGLKLAGQGLKGKPQSPWIKHVKKVQLQKGLSYKDALKEASKTYTKK